MKPFVSFEHRKYQRFDSERKVFYDFAYDFESMVEVEPIHSDEGVIPQRFKYSGVTRNVSLEGLCFRADHELRRGDLLNLEVFIPGDDQPVHLLGEVRWTFLAEDEQKPESSFDTGVVLRTVEGKGVRETIHFDENYHVYWSDVLESILGRFRILQEQKNNGTLPSEDDADGGTFE